MKSPIECLAGGAVCLLALSCHAAQTPALPAACDQGGHQWLMQATPAASTAPAARALWLNRQLAQWPGVKSEGNFRLYHSVTGQLVAQSGQPVTGADGALVMDLAPGPLPAELAARFRYVAKGALLTLRPSDLAQLSTLHRGQLVLVQQDEQGRVLQSSALQAAGAIDDLFAGASQASDLGAQVQPESKGVAFTLWAPTAQKVSLCLYATGSGPATAGAPLLRDAATGLWRGALKAGRSGQYYSYLVDVFVPGVGMVRNRVTDPYSISLTTDSLRSYIADLNEPRLKPDGWNRDSAPTTVAAPTDMTIYELHVRDFSINDASVPAAHRGKYLAFTDGKSNGMKHLQALARAGLTDVHLLPVFDIATIPEKGCTTPVIAAAAPDSEAQQDSVMAQAGSDCFNWGYDPFHFNAPEGSYASSAAIGATRILEFRRMVQALHRAGLRVGMDVVYNHTAASGQSEKSVLDRIVPGYYHRLDTNGAVEQSTCCANTATENRMMGKLMLDSVALWARDYRIDSFRFDLMAHQPRDLMRELQARVNAAAGRSVQLLGEGWNFGEVKDNARFVQASQLMLNGTGMGTFSDRGRDAIRGGSAADSGADLVRNQGYVNGLVYDPNALADPARPVADLLKAADLVRVGLAGSVRSFVMTDYLGVRRRLEQIDYSGQPAGYVSQPGEVVNYVENHDNQTLFDINAYRLPLNTSRDDRVRVQMLGAALNAFSQGVAYFHAGIDTLRSKSLDGNSFDSGDWFNRLDWTYSANHFGTGAPPAQDNRANYAWSKPLLANADIRPEPKDIALARDMFRDLLKIRASSTLFRLRTAEDIAQRLRFPNSGPEQIPTLQAGHLLGPAYPGAGFRELLYLVNVDKQSHDLLLGAQMGRAWVLHPVHRAKSAADPRPAAQARFDAATGRFTVPARTALVFVVP
jgi:pullulanase/glycogen debranching enzyme